jgi:hypothetical protein
MPKSIGGAAKRVKLPLSSWERKKTATFLQEVDRTGLLYISMG